MHEEFFLYLTALFGPTIMGCSNTNEISGGRGEPPKTFIEIDNKKFETTHGTYCWQGPAELLECKKPIKVKSGENITFVMDYEPKPNELRLVQMSNDKGKETEVMVKDKRCIAPTQRGVY